MRSFAKFARRVPDRQLFKLPEFRGELATEAWNEWTLLLWGQDLHNEISVKTGRKLKANTIEQRISLLKGLLSHRYGFQLAGNAPRLSSWFRAKRSADPLQSLRKKRRGLRRKHLMKVWRVNSDVRSSSFKALNEWAATTVAWHVFARGGELASVKKSDLSFHITRSGKRYARLWLRPLKKKRGALEPKIPQFIAERPGEEWEPYAALRRLIDAPIWIEGADQPLFRTGPRAAMSTGRFRALLKKYAEKLGFDPAEFGAHSARIGGATDLAASGPGGASELLIQAKGRWQSDIGKIYTRMTRRAHLAASDLMHRARGRDLEELIPSFTQQV